MKKITKEIEKVKTIDEIKQSFMNIKTGLDSSEILKAGYGEASDVKGSHSYAPESGYYKAMTLFEFDKGVLLLNSTPKLYQPFALQFFKDLQKEYKCEGQVERSLAEIITINFIRVLDIQKKIAQNSEQVKTRYDVQYISVLSKELDRAQRHYLTSVQTLRMLKMPQLAVNISTQNAFIGSNQVIQQNEIN